MLIKIKVTSEILEKSKFCGKGGGPYDISNKSTYPGYNCAIALAVREIDPKVSVGLSSIFWNNGNISTDENKTCSKLPEEAKIFIRLFDSLRELPEERVKLNPIEFEVDFPDELVEKIGIEEVKDILHHSKTLELV